LSYITFPEGVYIVCNTPFYRREKEKAWYRTIEREEERKEGIHAAV
jgi:hypothetical protein